MTKQPHPLRRPLAAALAAALLVGLSACGAQPQPSSSAPPLPAQKKASVTVLLPAGQEPLAELLAGYTAGGGGDVSAVYPAEGESYADAVKRESEAGTALIYVTDPRQLVSPLELTGQSENPLAAALAAAVPAGFAPTAKGMDALAIGVTASGYLVDTQLLAALCGAEDTDRLVADFYAADYEQWQDFCRGLAAYLQRPAKKTFTLNGQEYTFPDKKPAAAQGLTAVFAAPTGAEADWFTGGLDMALSALAPDRAGLAALDDAGWAVSQNTFYCLAQQLDEETVSLYAPEGEVERGSPYTGRQPVSRAQAEEGFRTGKALFYRAEATRGAALASADAAFAARMTILPVKLPLEQRDIARQDVAIDRLQRGVAVYAPGYLSVNAAAPAEQRAAALDLMVWLYTSQAGQSAVCDQLGLLPLATLSATGRLQAEIKAVLGQGDALSHTSFLLGQPALDELNTLMEENMLTRTGWGPAVCNTFARQVTLALQGAVR